MSNNNNIANNDANQCAHWHSVYTRYSNGSAYYRKNRNKFIILCIRVYTSSHRPNEKRQNEWAQINVNREREWDVKIKYLAEIGNGIKRERGKKGEERASEKIKVECQDNDSINEYRVSAHTQPDEMKHEKSFRHAIQSCFGWKKKKNEMEWVNEWSWTENGKYYQRVLQKESEPASKQAREREYHTIETI